MDTSPWLSVLIPVYNVELYLQACVESILMQADEQVEIVLLNDASTDGSVQVISRLQQSWPGRLRVLHHDRNRGLSAARNTMLDAARGRYVWFVDSDDLMAPGAIGELRATVDRDAPDLVLCDFSVLRERPRLKHRLRGESHRRTFIGPSGRTLTDRSVLFAGVLEGVNLHAWSKIAKRDLWADDLRFPQGRYFEDMMVIPRLVLRAQSFHHVARPWIRYRQRQGSILATMSMQKAQDMSRSLLGVREALASAPFQPTPRAQFALAYLAARNYIGAARYVAKHHPQHQAARLREFRQDFMQTISLDLRELRQAYLSRGWIWRWLRLQHWLQQAPLGSSEAR